MLLGPRKAKPIQPGHAPRSLLITPLLFNLQPSTSHLPLLRSDLPIHSGRTGASDGAVDPVAGAGDDG